MIASIAPIVPQDQILLLAGKRLDSNKTLEAYGLPSVCREGGRKGGCDTNTLIKPIIMNCTLKIYLLSILERKRGVLI